MDDHWPDLYADPYAVERVRRSVELLDAKPGQTVLDVGCNKREAMKFLPEGVEYVGIDGIYGDALDGGFNLHRRFDRILCLETLEHLQWPRKTLKSLAAHLHDSGICVISLPNEASLFHRLRGLLLGIMDQEAFGECGKHLHLPGLKQATAFVREEFHIAQMTTYVSLTLHTTRQPGLSILGKLIPKQLLIFLSKAYPSLFARGFIFVCKRRV